VFRITEGKGLQRQGEDGRHATCAPKRTRVSIRRKVRIAHVASIRHYDVMNNSNQLVWILPAATTGPICQT
jgi:hypothetical protein